ncbi:cupin domain-containing protein [Minwuia thermotolerans]|uniref:Cupin domain-containing protein n=1 Tax=Minwuia thermotolerans TaxID=2056226 RepID=A0A2M9G3T4_9PROT|nr:cupin domain-containing protein [Minwuia thermotolerans]PJK30382.1 cupin domain-containing protein [Minwuia thermotolerans]
MVEKVDIRAALADRPFFRGRAPDNEAEAGAAFARLGRINNGEIFAGSYSGDTPWERHRKGDELVQVLDGATTITILTAEGAERHELRGGQFVVVPAGCWHRFETPDGVTVMTATPLPTDHSSAADPRMEEN